MLDNNNLRMKIEFKYRIWIALGSTLILICTPIGIYSSFQSIKAIRRLKIGDYEALEKCVINIKRSWLVVLIFYIFLLVLGLIGALD